MTHKQIEASRELRLWIGQIIIPAVSVAAIVFTNPDVRRAAKEKLNDVRQQLHFMRNRAA